MNFNLSKKALSIEPSVTLAITAKAKAMKENGIDVLSFSVGEPDFNTPENIQNAGIEAIKTGLTKYTPVPGTIQLRKAICEKLKNENQLEYSPSQIIVSNGGKHSLYNALVAILNPGDEVIFSSPYWVSYPDLVRIADGVPVILPTTDATNFKFSSKELEKFRTDKTKAIIINSPSNPTGAVYTKQELEDIANWAIENNIIVISDELYERLLYDGEKHYSIASLNDEIKNRTLIVNGMSKAYSMTGWRIGYTAGPEEIIKVMTNIQSHTTSNASSISQYASIEGLLGNQTFVNEMREEFDKRRITMAKLINETPYISCLIPKGAFYIMMNIKELKGKHIKDRAINSSTDFAELLLDECRVAVVPGLAFGDDDYVRLSYATSMDNIKNGMKLISDLLKNI